MQTNCCMAWVRRAAGCIRWPPDRAAVERELHGHVLSRYQSFLDSGMSEAEADEAAAAAMGDPIEVGRELAAVHKPFWGFFLAVLRVLGICAALLAIVLLFRSYRSGELTAPEPYPEELAALETDGIRQTASANCGSYRFRVDRAVVLEDGEILIRIRYRTWNPLLRAPTLWKTELSLTDDRQNSLDCTVFYSRSRVFGGELYANAETGFPDTEWAVFRYDNGFNSFSLPVLFREVNP